ncbi:D-inositol-3-phosphate glycosyltransferase [anaerobic digester metagenome]
MRPIHAIHQFHAGSAFGDAVTNSMFFIRKILRDMGFISEIYVYYIAPELTHELLNYTEYKPNDKQILLIHHSMGHDIFDWITSLPDEKYLIYHNITPHDFFPMGSPNNYYSQLGRRQLGLLKDFVKGSICDSQYNQQELLDLGFQNTRVIPLLLNIDEILGKKWNQDVEIRNSYQFNILFVGRIAPNKCQHDIIEIGSYLKSVLTVPFKIHLIGGYDPGDPYYQDLCTRINNKNLSDFVNIPGKVTDEDLYGYYRAADLFLCMSEHEGFGVPLIEAMVFNIPIIAYNSSNIPYTLGNSGILVNKKDPIFIATLIDYLLQNKQILRRITKYQREHLISFSLPTLIHKLNSFFLENCILVPLKPDPTLENPKLKCNKYRIEGPFDSSYSLAIVNREIALALNNIYPNEVSLYSTDGLKDYSPSCNQISLDVKKMWKEASSYLYARVVMRNLYPPRASNMIGDIKIVGSYGWEESGFPSEYVNGFHAHLDGIATVSDYVTQLLINNGVSLPIHTMGNGIDHCLTIKEKKYRRSLGKGFRFLHISSCFPRKGVDILLKAYTMAFSNQDDVSLIIKTVPHHLNTIPEQVEYYKNNNHNCPEIILINEDLDYGYIINLYKRCNAYVGPSRGEGFGLPFAEAMLFELPVIITGYGGQTDFCNEDNAWLIDFSFAYADTHIGLNDSVWVEPSPDHLAILMKEVINESPEKIKQKTGRAKENIIKKYSWEMCSKRLDKFCHAIEVQDLFPHRIRLGWVSRWADESDIVLYSKNFVENFDPTRFENILLSDAAHNLSSDEPKKVNNCGDCGSFSSVDSIYHAVLTHKIEIVVLQLDFRFINYNEFIRLINLLSEAKITIISIIHFTIESSLPIGGENNTKCDNPDISEALNRIDKIFVHCVNDLNNLKKIGVVANTAIFPYGIKKKIVIEQDKMRSDLNLLNKKVITFHGSIYPYKGLKELIGAFGIVNSLIQDSHLVIINTEHPDENNRFYLEQCQLLMQDLKLTHNITMVSIFSGERETTDILSLSNLIVYPYQHSQKTSSRSVRDGIASGVPVLCSPISTFDDVASAVNFFSGFDCESMAQDIISQLQKERVCSESHFKWIIEHQWEVLSNRLQNIISSVWIQSQLSVK